MGKRALIPAVLAVSMLAFAVADGGGCGQTTSAVTKTVTAPSPPPATATLPDTTTDTTTDTTSTTDTTNLTGPVGTPYTDTDANGNVMSVTLVRVIDPAQGADEFTTPDNGKRFVAARFLLAGVSGSFQDDANSDAAVVGSDGQTYTADFSDVAGCTNFNNGDFSVSPGQQSAGCVVFQVPDGVKVASVQWGGQFGGTPATWTVGS